MTEKENQAPSAKAQQEGPITTVHCIIGNEDGTHLLLVEQEMGWILPNLQWPGHDWFPYYGEPISTCAKKKFNLDATMLRHIHKLRRNQGHIYELETHQTNWPLPDRGRWVDKTQLPMLTLAIESQRPFMDAWFAEADTAEAPLLRSPWEQRGWLSDALAWIDAHVERTGEVGYVKGGWGCSCILRVPVAGENLYFKAVYDKTPSEVDVIVELSERWPENVPTIVAADSDRRWMLMRDFGEDLLYGKDDERWGQAVRLMAELQIDSANDIDRWLKVGCPLWTPEAIPDRVDHMVADTDVLTAKGRGLNEDEVQQVRDAVPRWNAMWMELASYKIPASLSQQDFRVGNLAVTGDAYIFYDWSDTVVAHPFFSIRNMLSMIQPPEGVAGSDPDYAHPDDSRRRCVRDSYLEPWTCYAPIDRLMEAFALVHRLNELYMAMRCYHEVAHLEPGSPWHEISYSNPSYHLMNMLSQESRRTISN